MVVVCYHCGGWPEEVNSCVLNSYMVYLYPKQSLGYQRHSFRLLLLYIYTTGIIQLLQSFFYVHEHRLQYTCRIPLAFYLPLPVPFCSPFQPPATYLEPS